MTEDGELSDHVVFSGQQGYMAVRSTTEGTSLRLRFGPLDGRVCGNFVFFDPALVREELKALLGRPDLTGEVRLVKSEHEEVVATVVLKQGSGTLVVDIATAFAGGECGRLELITDQAAMAAAVRDIDRLFVNPSQ